jgi:hypothetical protein
LKKLIYILVILLSISSISFNAFADNTDAELIQSKTDRYIKYVYDKLSFKKMQHLSFEAFSKGFYGYLNIKEAGKVHGNALLTICDFSLSSNLKRMWVIDVAKKKVLFNSLVAHGSGTGEEFATKFSNIHESHQSSLGFYTTAETYVGDNGYSLKLHGIDGEWNNNAFDRGVVIHGAEYVSTSFARDNNRLGRSHGCPALPMETASQIISKIQNGSVLFIYHNTKKYLKNSYWLNNKISHLPSEASSLEVLMPASTNPRWKDMSEKNDSLATIQIAKNFVEKRTIAKDTHQVKVVQKVNSDAEILKALEEKRKTLNNPKAVPVANAVETQKPKTKDFLLVK